MRIFFSRSFAKFVAIGGVAALANFFSRRWLQSIMSFKFAVLSSYLIGMVVSFFLLKAFVFRQTQNSLSKSWSYFVGINLIGICLCWGVSMLFAYAILPNIGVESYRFEVAHILGLAAPMFTSFLGHKHFSFRDEK